MGSSSGGLFHVGRPAAKQRSIGGHLKSRQRANMSFFIVVMFFAVFGIILFTEIFMIDERGRQNGGGGVLVRHGGGGHRRRQAGEKEDYDDAGQSEDYISIMLNQHNPDADTVGALLLGVNHPQIPGQQSQQLLHEPGPNQMVLTESQLPSYPANMTPLDGQWQIVNGTRFKFYVFSAYYDWRKGQRAIRVIATTKTRGPARVWCRFWYRSNEGNTTNYYSYTTLAKAKVIRENWNLKYSACFLLCPLQINQSVPHAVSVAAKLKFPAANLILVQNNFNETKPSNKFGICVKPLHFDYNRALQLMEFIELNRILGVVHFTVYNHTIGKQVACILDDYVQRGIVTLLPWQLNMLSQKEIRTEGLFAALNDCLYRSMNKFSHVLLIDLDEYIVPRHNDTLPELVSWLATKSPTRSAGSYSFQNAFFYLQWGDDDWVYDSADPLATGLVTLTKTRRKTKLHSHKQRSKYICKPELIIEAGNHFVWEFLPGHGTYNVPSESAILQHYRICEFGGDDCIKTSSVVDTSAFKYRDRLVSAVQGRYDSCKGKCALLELPPPPERAGVGLQSMLGIFSKDQGKSTR